MPKADDTVDARDKQCPLPILIAKKKIKEMDEGQILEVLSNDPGSKEDFPRWAKRTGNELVSVIDESDYARYFIKKLS